MASALNVSFEYLIGQTNAPEESIFDGQRARTYYQSAIPKRLPPKAYELVYGYTEKLRAAGLAADELEEAERFLLDGAYNKLNAREPGEKSQADLILDIKAAWQFVQDVLTRSGRKL